MKQHVELIQFLKLIKASDEPGFYLIRPYHRYAEIVGVHNAHNQAIAWESELSFAAYRLYRWLTNWSMSKSNLNLVIVDEVRWLFDAWIDCVGSKDRSIACLSCWHRKPRHYPMLYPNQAEVLEQWNAEQAEAIQLFNQWIDKCRSKVGNYPNLILPEPPKAQLKQGAKRNYYSARDYLETLKEKYSRLLVIRLDLFYQEDFKESKGLNFLKRDKELFFRNNARLQEFKDLVGHVWCYEYGESKGVHCHLLLFFDGKYRMKDEWIGRQLGERWVAVTKGEGGYYNINNKDSKDRLKRWQIKDPNYLKGMQKEAPEQASELIKSTVKMQGEGKNTLAIGLVERNNDVAWTNLNEVVRYFTKLDQAIPKQVKGNIRCFGRGEIMNLSHELDRQA